MSDHEPRLWPHDEAIRRVGEGFLARTLPKPEWTHEAHISTTCWLILERAADIVPERDLPDLIRRYNESVGGVNSDTEGYHETITQVFIRTLRRASPETEGQGAVRAGQRGAAGAGGAAGLAVAVLSPRAAVFEGGAAGLGGAGSDGVASPVAQAMVACPCRFVSPKTPKAPHG